MDAAGFDEGSVLRALSAVVLLLLLNGAAGRAQTSGGTAAQQQGLVPSETDGAPAISPEMAALRATLLANTTALFRAFQRRDILAFLRGVTPEFTYVGPEGVLPTEQLAGVVQGCALNRYSVLEPQVRVLTADAAVLVYRHRQEATCRGKRMPPEMLGSDSYVRRDGRWRIAVHTETVPQ